MPTDRTRRTRRLAALLLATTALIALAGCGEREENLNGATEEIDFVLDFFVNPDHAGIYTALARGDFDEAGLAVDPVVPSDPAAPIKLVAAGRADLAISYEPEVILARDQGLDVVAVAAIVNSPLSSVITLPRAKVDDIRDLQGKTIATAGIGYQDAFLEAILGRVGLETDDVKAVNVGLNLQPALLSGRADALLGAFRNIEGVELEERGKNPTVIPVDELGVPTYDELVLVARRDQVESDPEPIRLFIAALEQGTRAAIADPALATQAVLEASDGLDPALTRAEIRATLPLLTPERGRPYGEMNAAEWDAFAGFMADQGLTTRRWTAGELLTNDLLPGRFPD